MANELTINASIAYDDDVADHSMDVVDRPVTPSTLLSFQNIQSIGTSEESIQLGGLASLGNCMFKNLDPTNFVTLLSGTGGLEIAILRPDTNSDGKGGIALLDLGDDIQAPFAIANTGACRIEVLLNAR